MTQLSSPRGSEWVYLDLDRTFSARSTEPFVARALWREGLITAADLAKVGLAYVRYKLDLIPDMPGTKRLAVRHLLGGKPVAGVTAAVETCFRRELLGRIRLHLAKEMEEHRRAGRGIVLLTSTLDLIAAPFYRHFGFDALIATRLEVMDGLFTGGVAGNIPYGEAKAEAARTHAAAVGADLARCFAYGDRYGDRFLMEEVGNAVAVCPDRKLIAIARARGWRIDQNSD